MCSSCIHHTSPTTPAGNCSSILASSPMRTFTDAESDTSTSPCHLSRNKAHWVFVYGTLKRGFANHSVLDGATFLGRFRSLVPYPLVVGGAFFSPYLLDIPGKGERVLGEVYAVCDATLARLDILENVGVNYSRRTMTVADTHDPSFTATAFVYLKCNYSNDLLSKPTVADYQCRKYVPRHRRPRHSTSEAVLVAMENCVASEAQFNKCEVVGDSVASCSDASHELPKCRSDLLKVGLSTLAHSNSSRASFEVDVAGSPVSTDNILETQPLLAAFTKEMHSHAHSQIPNPIPAFEDRVGVSMYAGTTASHIYPRTTK